MKVIYKYRIGIVDFQVDFQFVEMPKNAKILSAQVQADTICLWVLCDPELPAQKRRVFLIGTGNPFNGLSPGVLHIDSIQIGAFVWHVFAENEYPYLDLDWNRT